MAMTAEHVALTLMAVMCAEAMTLGLSLGWDPDEVECPDEASHMLPLTQVGWGDTYQAFKTIPKGICIQPSLIKNAGIGVFTQIFLAKHTWLAEYEGTPQKDCTELPYGCDYTFEVFRKGEQIGLVDAGDLSTSNWLRWINCARSQREQNVIARECRGNIYYQTLKDVAPSSELLVYYGDNFAKDLGINTERFAETSSNTTSKPNTQQMTAVTQS